MEPAREKGAYGGRGSGKSHFFAEQLIEDSMAEPGNSGGEGLRSVCLREVQKDLAQSAKLLIEQKLKHFRVSEANGFKIFRDVIETPADGLIIFKGMNDYSSDSIKSLENFKRGWWEESHTATANSLRLYRPTLRADGAERWYSWNPRRKVDPVDVMFRGKEVPTGAISVRANWSDNAFWTAELETQRLETKRLEPEQYEHIWEGGYVTALSGAYFARHLRDAREEGRVGNVAPDPLMTYRLFFDIGGTGAKADACAIWVCQFIGREIRALDYYEAVGQPLATHVAWMKKEGYTPDKAEVWLPHDGKTHDKVFKVSYESALKDAEYNVEVIPNQGKGAAMARVEAARRLFPSVWFNERKCEGGLDALGWYHERKDENRDIGLGPEHDWSSHGADAFGLMAVAAERIFKKQDKPQDFNPYKGLE
jgi:phage terminase large subunit